MAYFVDFFQQNKVNLNRSLSKNLATIQPFSLAGFPLGLFLQMFSITTAQKGGKKALQSTPQYSPTHKKTHQF